ncbi:hypothetical protein Mapa_015994 [Marchantia paleacea]|nr:hypothetical protein Mapa_015994 [Marchantia paleacea]
MYWNLVDTICYLLLIYVYVYSRLEFSSLVESHSRLLSYVVARRANTKSVTNLAISRT